MIDTSNVIDFINVRVAGDDGSPRMHKVGVLHKEWVEIEGKSYLFAIHLHTTTAKGYTATHWVSGLALCHGGTPEETVINLHNRVLMGLREVGADVMRLKLEMAEIDDVLNALPVDEEEDEL